jgi:hypothetical protein
MRGKEVIMETDTKRTTPPPDTSMSGITIACRRFDYHGNGTITLWFPSIPLKEEHRQALRELFPNLGEKAYELLSKENLLTQLELADGMAPAYEDKISHPRHY